MAKEVPSALDSHLVVDNCLTHKHVKVQAWLARHPRFPVQFTYPSWINQVERWSGLISQRIIKRGKVTTVSDLVQCIDVFTRNYNTDASPLVWVATAQPILAKTEGSSTRVPEQGL